MIYYIDLNDDLLPIVRAVSLLDHNNAFSSTNDLIITVD
jgi:hypothetical protein